MSAPTKETLYKLLQAPPSYLSEGVVWETIRSEIPEDVLLVHGYAPGARPSHGYHAMRVVFYVPSTDAVTDEEKRATVSMVVRKHLSPFSMWCYAATPASVDGHRVFCIDYGYDSGD